MIKLNKIFFLIINCALSSYLYGMEESKSNEADHIRSLIKKRLDDSHLKLGKFKKTVNELSNKKDEQHKNSLDNINEQQDLKLEADFSPSLNKSPSLGNNLEDMSKSIPDTNILNNLDDKKIIWPPWTRGDSCFFGGLFLVFVWGIYRYFTYEEEMEEIPLD